MLFATLWFGLCCGVDACIGGLVRLLKFGLAGFDLDFGCLGVGGL